MEELVKNSLPVYYLHFIERSGYSLPILSDTRETRIQKQKILNDPNSISNLISKQATEILEQNKNDSNASLLMPIIKLKD